MPKFKVTSYYMASITNDVEAEDRAEARKKADDLIDALTPEQFQLALSADYSETQIYELDERGMA